VVMYAGNLYGTTEGGGNSPYDGIVFELKHSGNAWSESILYSFTGGSDGGRPFAGLTIRDGNLYGTTISGGSGGGGVVFELQPSSTGWTETVLYAFKGHPDGANPEAGVIFDQSGNLYGTTSFGGWRYCQIGCGTVFKLTPKSGGGWQETVLYRFNGRGVGDGENSDAGLLQDAKGHLYGTTSVGGGAKSCPFGCGVVFELSP